MQDEQGTAAQDRELLAELDPASGGVARRALMSGVSLAAAMALLGAGSRVAEAAEGSFPAHKRWRLTFVNHVTTNPFFVPTQYAIADACAMFGCQHQWTGSANACYCPTRFSNPQY